MIQVNMKYAKGEANVVWSSYADGSPALMLVSPTGARLCVASVRLETPPDQNCIWIKDWSENEGIFQALIENKVIEDTGIRQRTGYVEAKLGRILEKGR